MEPYQQFLRMWSTPKPPPAAAPARLQPPDAVGGRRANPMQSLPSACVKANIASAQPG